MKSVSAYEYDLVDVDTPRGRALAKSVINPKPSRAPSLEDQIIFKYRVYERMLAVVLTFTSLCSVALFILFLWLRHGTENFLYFLMKRAIDRKLFEAEQLFDGMELNPPLLWHGEKQADGVYLGRWVRVYTDLMMTIVLLLWSTSFAGWLCIHEKNRIFSYAFILCNFVNIVSEMMALGIIYGGFKPMADGIQHDMTHILVREYSVLGKSVVNRIVNSIMVLGECCGIGGPADFKNMAVIDHDQFVVPRACCKMEWWVLLHDKYAPQILECMAHGDDANHTMINRQGCFKAWTDLFYDGSHTYVVAFVGVLCGMQLVQLIFGLIICRFTSSLIRLDKDQLRESNCSSQNWVSGLRATTLSEMTNRIPDLAADNSTSL